MACYGIALLFKGVLQLIVCTGRNVAGLIPSEDTGPPEDISEGKLGR
jgi:hypothetical protein